MCASGAIGTFLAGDGAGEGRGKRRGWIKGGGEVGWREGMLEYRGDMSIGKGRDCLGGRGSGLQLSNDCVVQKTFSSVLSLG